MTDRSLLDIATGKKFRRRSSHRESEEQRLFVARWRLDPRTRDLPACAIPNAGRRSKVTGGILKAEGMSRGVPDWLCFHGRVGGAEGSAGDARGLALEFKSPDGSGRLTDDQRWWHAELCVRGWRVEIVTTAAEAWRVVVGYLRLREP